MNKSLEELFSRMDALSGNRKTVSEATTSNDEVMKLAEDLISSANNIELEQVANDEALNEELSQAEIDEMAIAVNRLEAIEQARMLQKIASFQKLASEKGFSPQAIEEEIEKIASEKVLEILPYFSGTMSEQE